MLIPVLLFMAASVFGQTDVIFSSAKKKTIKNYLLDNPRPLEAEEFKILIHLDYGEAYLKNRYALSQLNVGKVKEVNLYYSGFPIGHQFAKLNKERISGLLNSTSSLTESDITWNIVKQTACKNKAEAEALFHGFEIIVEFSEEFKAKTLAIDTSVFEDFVVKSVLERNEWTEMLVVSDMTGSMTPYISQLLLWMKLNTTDERIKQFVFFNDGDTNLDEDKEVGKTGGIYTSKSKEYKDVENLAIQSMLNGDGGDSQENDIEALLEGIQLCPDCKENILIADNGSPMRDYELLEKLDRPIRVVLCGAEHGVKTEYLNLARATGGSIHLIEEDIMNLVEINEGEIIEINGMEYIIQENKFMRYNRI